MTEHHPVCLMRSPRALLGLLLFMPQAHSLSAQELRGRVVSGDGLGGPVEGAIVTLIDENVNAIDAVFTNEFGAFTISADSAGTYRVRIDRIGFERWLSGPVVLTATAPTMAEYALPILPVRLAELDVSVYKDCVDDPRDASEVELVFDEARKALESQLLAQTMELFRFSSVVFNRALALNAQSIIEVSTFASQGLSRAPFRSLAADRLSADGYIQEEGLTIYYYAPDAPVLLSDAFQRDHCFGLDREERDGRGYVGLTFEPRDGRDLPDISGVLWLDEQTNALDHVEFEYENIPYRGVDDDRIAGIVEYGQLPNGAFIVRDWYIRMPNLVYNERRDRYSLDGFTEYGGELRSVAEPEGEELDWKVGAGISGTITNPLTDEPLRDATLFLDVPRGEDRIRHTGPAGRFFFDGLAPGDYRLWLDHPLLDTIDSEPQEIEFELYEGEELDVLFSLPTPERVLEDFCGSETDGTAVIVGRVRDRESLFPLGRARLWAEWTRPRLSAEPGDNHGLEVLGTDETRADRVGRYALCDVPLGLDVAVSVIAGGERTGARSVRVERLVNVVDFLLDPSR